MRKSNSIRLAAILGWLAFGYTSFASAEEVVPVTNNTVVPSDTMPKLDAKDDPLGTAKKPIKTADDLLNRILNRSTKDQDLSVVTKNVIEGAVRSTPKEMNGLSIQTMNEALNSDNVISQLKQNSKYFSALAETVSKANDLVQKTMELQQNRDKIAAINADGKHIQQMFAQLSKKLEEQSQQIIELRNQNLILASQIDRLHKSNKADNQSHQAAPTPQAALNDSRKKSAIYSPPFAVDNTSIAQVDGKTTKKAHIILLSGKSMWVGIGYVSGAVRISNITNSGVEITPVANNGPSMLLSVNPEG